MGKNSVDLLTALFRGEALDRCEAGGAHRRIHAGADGDGGERDERRDDGEWRDGRTRKERRQWNEPEGRDDGERTEQAEATADERDDCGLGEELAADVACGGAERLADADLAGALGHGDEHDVHDADAAKREREQGDGGEEDRHYVEDAVGELDTVERVPDPERVEIDGVEVVARAEHLADLAHRGFMQLWIYGLHDDVVHKAGRSEEHTSELQSHV